jgi:oligopeptide/dipeptide ABC transporter ATP-binding protein
VLTSVNASSARRTPDPVLSVRRLGVTFGERVAAVSDVSFDLRRGQKLAIVGESGSGKSSLALALMGLIDPPGRVVSGSVTLNGRDLVPLDDGVLRAVRGREISLIFQDAMSALDPVKTVGAQLVDTLRRHQHGLSRDAARWRAVALLREVEVPDAERRLDDYPHQYSGGMRQRVMIAIALANDPDVVVADEPTTALDVTTQAQILALLDRAVAVRGAAVLLITHNLAVVSQFCDEVAVMYAGRVVERGSTEAVFDRPLHPYTAALLAALPRADWPKDQPLAAIPGAPPDLAALPRGCSFEPRCPYGHGRDVCRDRRPSSESVAEAPFGIAEAECHFVAERLARVPPVGVPA